jgi:hypothetical protein
MGFRIRRVSVVPIVRTHPSRETKARRMGYPQVFLLGGREAQEGHDMSCPYQVGVGGGVGYG